MKQLHTKRLELVIYTIVGLVSLMVLPASALSQTTATSSSSTNSATQAKLQLIISVGNGEIQRRLTTLSNLTSGISSAQFLTASDKSTLSNEVTTESSDLTSLKTKLDSETTISAATTDDLDVITEYRVYVLVVPKVYIVITADDQQVEETALTNAATTAQQLITSAKNAGKNVTTLQSELSNLSSSVSAAQSISSAMESGVIGLQPTDYNSDHSILVGDYNKLQTAQSDIQSAVTDANNILTGLQSL